MDKYGKELETVGDIRNGLVGIWLVQIIMVNSKMESLVE